MGVEGDGGRLDRADHDLLIKSIGLCHSCNHVMLAKIVDAEYRKETEEEGYIGWDNWVKKHG